MKKIISQSQFDRLYEKSFDGLGKNDENGNFIFYDGRFDMWLSRIKFLSDSFIVMSSKAVLCYIKEAIIKYMSRYLEFNIKNEDNHDKY